MLRFPCPRCGHHLKAPENRAGTTVLCRQCMEPCRVPAPPTPVERAATGGGGTATAMGELPGGRAAAWGSLWTAGPWLRGAAALVATVGLVSLLLAVTAPLLGATDEAAAAARHDAVLLVPSCLVIFLVLLYGHATSCPHCGKWWVRAEGDTEYLGREPFDRGGRAWVRALRRINYVCKSCHHTWSATSTDEYQDSTRRRQKRVD